MKLSLVVEGKKQNVCAAHFREGKINSVSVLDENNVVVTYHDTKEKTTYYVEKPLQVDFEKFLKWEGKHDDIIDAIKKRIEAKEERLIELGQEFMASYFDKKVVYPEVQMDSFENEYNQLQASLNGLYEALDIVYELGGVENSEK